MKALRKLAWVEFKLFARDPLSMVFTLVLPLFFLIVLNGVFGTEPESDPEDDVWLGVSPANYYVPAYVGLVMAAIGVLSLPTRVAGYREIGVLKRFRASSMPLFAILSAQVGITFAVAAVGAVTMTLASAAIYGTQFPDSFVLVLAGFVLSALAFAALGVCLGSVLPTSRSAQGLGLMLFFVMFLLSGSGPPRDALSGGMRTASDFLPLTYVVQLLQDGWLQASWNATAALVVLGMLLIATALSFRLFRWE